MDNRPTSDVFLQPGEVLDGKYEIIGKIGQGGMGVVYKARATALQRKVAIKMLTHVDEHTLRRFQREALSLAQVDHLAVVRVDHFGDAGPLGPYLVLAYVPGQDLGDVAQTNLSIPDAVDLALAIATGISACHRRGIIHRDLKPSNVRVTTATSWHSRVKILDFGLALPFDSPILQAYQTRITSAGSVPGTPRYIAPELLRHHEPSVQCDQYGLASLLYLLLTRRAPFEDLEGEQLLRAIMDGGIVKPSLFRTELPGELERILFRGLHKDPTQRFDSVDDFADELVPFASPNLQTTWTHYFANARRPLDRRLIEPVSGNPRAVTGGTIISPMSDPSVVPLPKEFHPQRIPTPAEPPPQVIPTPLPAISPRQATPPAAPYPTPAPRRRRHHGELANGERLPASRSQVFSFAAGVVLGSALTVGAFFAFLAYQHRATCSASPVLPAYSSQNVPK